MPFPDMVVGYQHYNDPGADPLPCWDRTAPPVQFDWNQVNTYVQAHDINTALRSDSALKGDVNCVSQIQENSDNVGAYNPFPDVIPGGQSLTPAPQVSAGVATVDLAGMIALR